MFAASMMAGGMSAGLAIGVLGQVLENLAAEGTTQDTAYQMQRATLQVFSTVTAGAGTRLPSGMNPNEGLCVYNGSAVDMNLYPPVGGTINNAAANIPIIVSAGTAVSIGCINKLQFVSVIGGSSVNPIAGVAASQQFVLTTGNDANDGYSWATARLTIQAAYTTLAASHNYGDVFVGPGIYELTDTLYVPQGIRLHGTWNAGSQGTTILYNGPDDGRAAIHTSRFNATPGVFANSFGILENFHLLSKNQKTLGYGIEFVNAQNMACLRNIMIGPSIAGSNHAALAAGGSGSEWCFPAGGVHVYTDWPNPHGHDYPGFVQLDRIWVEGGAKCFHIRSGYTTMLISNCGVDTLDNTDSAYCLDPPLVSSVGENIAFDLCFLSCKVEIKNYVVADVSYGDCDGFVFNVDSNITCIGCDVKSSRNPNTAFTYNGTPATENDNARSPTIDLIMCHSSNMDHWFVAPNVVPPIDISPPQPAAGIPYRNTFIGRSIQPEIAAGAISAETVLIQANADEIPLAVKPYAGGQVVHLAEFSGFSVEDTFDRANGAIGTADTGQVWNEMIGTWTVDSNKARVAVSLGDPMLCTLDALVPDGTLTCDLLLSAVVDRGMPGLVFRCIDSLNYLRMNLMNTGLSGSHGVILNAFNAGVRTILVPGPNYPIVLGATYRVKVILAGPDISVYVNDVFKYTYTLTGADAAKFTTPTLIGLGTQSSASSGDSGGSRWDNFRFAVPAFGVDGLGYPKWIASAYQQDTVGAAGGASALPATPKKYLKVKMADGTILVIPAYLAS